MFFIKSILFGYEGSYNVLGIPVKFEEKNSHWTTSSSNSKKNKITQLITNLILTIINPQHVSVFVHEMSHAFAFKLLTGKTPNVIIYTLSNEGVTDTPYCSDDWKKTIYLAAGPVGSMTFAICQRVAANSLKDYLSQPVARVLAFWAISDMINQLNSAFMSDNADFCKIAKQGKLHLTLATAALVGLFVFGIRPEIRFVACDLFHLPEKLSVLKHSLNLRKISIIG